MKRAVAVALAALAVVAFVALRQPGYDDRRGDPLLTGLVANEDGVHAARWAESGLRPAVARVEFPVSAPAADLRAAIEAHAANGTTVLPLATFTGRLPTAGEARNLATWAGEFGPGGPFWADRADGRLAVREIEFGNETSLGYQYGDSPGDPSYAARARDYALRFADAQEAIHAANPAVGLLAQADGAGHARPDWVDGMFAAVPDLGERVAGWTVHPYGRPASWRPRLDRLVEQTAAHDAERPVWITEWGLSSDDGRCLDSNYGWDACMTYAAAADALRTTVRQMRETYGERLAAFLLYQGADQRLPGASTGREHYFGALRADQSRKGAYTEAVASLLAGAP